MATISTTKFDSTNYPVFNTALPSIKARELIPIKAIKVDICKTHYDMTLVILSKLFTMPDGLVYHHEYLIYDVDQSYSAGPVNYWTIARPSDWDNSQESHLWLEE